LIVCRIANTGNFLVEHLGLMVSDDAQRKSKRQILTIVMYTGLILDVPNGQVIKSAQKTLINVCSEKAIVYTAKYFRKN
jgi:hypothetical protein